MTKFGPNKTKKHLYVQILLTICVVIILSFVVTATLLTLKPELKDVMSNYFNGKTNFITSRVDYSELIDGEESSSGNDVDKEVEDSLPPNDLDPAKNRPPVVVDEDGYMEEHLVTDPLPTDESVSSTSPSPVGVSNPTGQVNDTRTSMSGSTSVGIVVSSSMSPSHPPSVTNVTSLPSPLDEDDVNPNQVMGEVIPVSDVKLPAVDALRGQPVVVKTPSGKVKGIQGVVFGKKVNAFYGIPFAQPPIGHLRFKRTVKVKPWRGILEATTFKPHCPQYFDLEVIEKRTPLTHVLAEDCLYLNIWAPAPDRPISLDGRRKEVPQVKKPVMVWFFGGGYAYGSNNLDEFDGRVLSSIGDVIVVTANYRLGSFGFLDLGINDSPGNQGLYDNKEALIWIRQNIESFGGDPDQITVFGQSAGAISVGLLMVHNHTSSLFKRAILQSGSPIMLNFFFTRTEDTAERFISSMGCTKSGESTPILPDMSPDEQDEREFDLFKKKRQKELDCLMTKSTQELITGQRILMKTAFPFTPSPYELFLPVMPAEAIKADFRSNLYYDTFNNVNEVLMGSNRDEGSVILHLEIPEIFKIDSINLNITKLSELKELLVSNFSREFALEPGTAQLFANLFFSKGPETDTTLNLIRRLYEVIGGLAFTCPVASFAEALTTRGKSVYQYEFNYRSSASPWGKWMGVTHGDEYLFTFGHPLRYPSKYSKEDMEMSQRMIQIWSYFAKTGKVPLQGNKRWPQYTLERGEYMKLKYQESGVSYRIHEEVCSLFNIGLDSLRRRRRRGLQHHPLSRVVDVMTSFLKHSLLPSL